jgi:branched-chain amino acid transport system permease protein
MINWDFTNASSSYNMPAQGLVDLKTIFVYTVVLAAVTILSVVILINSPLGLRLVALRDDEFGAASVGVRRVRTLIPVWALSGFLTGLMGALYAVQRGTLTVDSAFNIQFSLDAAIVSVLGGLGTVGGPIIGSFLVYYLRFFSDDFSNWALLIEAIILIVIVRFFPSGLVGMFRLVIEKARALIRR